MANTETAILAGGCFWGVQDLIRKLPGVTATRVGYSGGDVPHATYRNHGTHAEAIEVVFDPTKLSYRELLEFFFQIHDPTTNRRRRGLGALARTRCDGGTRGGAVLGSRARAPGLPAAQLRWLHVPLSSP